MPPIPNSNPHTLLKMLNEPSSPVLEPSQPFIFELSLSNQALRELNIGTPRPEVPNEDPITQMKLLSYEIRDWVQKKYFSDTTTRRRYETYVKDYIKWWENNEFSLL